MTSRRKTESDDEMKSDSWGKICNDIRDSLARKQTVGSLPNLMAQDPKISVSGALCLANIPSLSIRLPRGVFVGTFINYLKSLSGEDMLQFLSGLSDDAFRDFTQTGAATSIGERIPFVVDQLVLFRDADTDRAGSLIRAIRDEFLKRGINPQESIAAAAFFLASDSSRDEAERTRLLSLLSYWFGRMNPDHLWRIFAPQNRIFVRWALDSGRAGQFDTDPERLLNYFWVCVAFARDRLADLRPLMARAAAAMPGQRTPRLSRVANSLAWIGDSRIRRLAAARPGVQPERKQRLRIALCVSGQMRGYREAFPTWRKALSLDDVDFDVYLHTWKLLGRKKLTPHHAYRNFPTDFAKVFSAEWTAAKQQFPTRYPALFDLFENQENIDAADVREVLQPVSMVVDDDDIFPAQVPNVFRMHYKNERCYDLAQMSGKEYDLFVRLRPDKSFGDCGGIDWEQIYTSVVSEDCLYTDTGPTTRMPHGLVMGDQFLIAGALAAPAIFRSWSMPAALTQVSLGGQLQFQEMGYMLRQHYSLAVVSHFAGCHAERFPYPVFLPADGLLDPAPVSMARVYDVLLADASGRMDAMDTRLISAARACVEAPLP